MLLKWPWMWKVDEAGWTQNGMRYCNKAAMLVQESFIVGNEWYCLHWQLRHYQSHQLAIVRKRSMMHDRQCETHARAYPAIQALSSDLLSAHISQSRSKHSPCVYGLPNKSHTTTLPRELSTKWCQASQHMKACSEMWQHWMTWPALKRMSWDPTWPNIKLCYWDITSWATL